MPVKMDVDIIGMRELEDALRKLSVDVKGNPLRKAVRKMTKQFFDAAVINAQRINDPETRTNIADAMGIRLIPLSERDKYTAAGDSFEGYEVGPRKKGKGLKRHQEGPQPKGAYLSAWYAHFIEFGTDKQTAQPFMRPALETTLDECIDAFEDDMRATIKRQVTKLNKIRPKR